jgi:uncharacterized protein (DUF885 family)
VFPFVLKKLKILLNNESSSKELNSLAKEYFELLKANDPLFATALGFRRFDDKLRDNTLSGRLRMKSGYSSIVTRCKEIEEDQLSDLDKLTRIALIVDATNQLEYITCALDDWAVDPLGGPQVEFMNIESYQPVSKPNEGQAMATRWRAMGQYIDNKIENLRRGASENKIAVRALVEKVVQEIEELLSKPDSTWALLRPLAVSHNDWSETELREFKESLNSAVSDIVRPAFTRYCEFLKAEILNRARTQDRPGLMHIPDGLESYSRLIRIHTSLDLTPEELHQTGLEEVDRINKEIEKLGKKVFGTGDRKEILKRLRTDGSLYFSTREEIAEKAEQALAKAKLAIPKYFGRLPKADCEVVRMEGHEEKHSTIAYYRQPAADGSRPGRYYINTSEPATRPKYEAEALAYHESIPGHHLQIAIAQELENIPDFRKHSGVTAFVEGWGLYAERLADEMGLYSSDLDRIGILSFDAWRACRLVVDTGMHAMGWSRDQAINFMFGNTALAKNNIINEVDRYITWPGQALAYKTGQLEIIRLRKKVQEKKKERFEISEFHDTLLSNGALPLDPLKLVFEEYSS